LYVSKQSCKDEQEVAESVLMRTDANEKIGGKGNRKYL
jgi:hypothetical protein